MFLPQNDGHIPTYPPTHLPTHLPNCMRSEPKLPQQKRFYNNGKLHCAASNSRPPVISYVSSELDSKFEISSANTSDSNVGNATRLRNLGRSPQPKIVRNWAFLTYFNIYTCVESTCLICWDGHKYHSVDKLADFQMHIATSTLLSRLGAGYAA